jgi:putative colanic acid biosynthesis UDP-glucose lipid carrier transferase
MQSPGPLFYKQVRSGLKNRPFTIYKFRTMHVNNPDESRQARIGDRRIFAAGSWLRKMSIDELPQFLNVLRGDMSVVGPRPHMIEHNALFSRALENYHIRAVAKPGITGLAQVRGFRGEASQIEDIVKRVTSDVYYLEHWSFALDCSIVARTALQMLRPPQQAR